MSQTANDQCVGNGTDSSRPTGLLVRLFPWSTFCRLFIVIGVAQLLRVGKRFVVARVAVPAPRRCPSSSPESWLSELGVEGRLPCVLVHGRRCLFDDLLVVLKGYRHACFVCRSVYVVAGWCSPSNQLSLIVMGPSCKKNEENNIGTISKLIF